MHGRIKKIFISSSLQRRPRIFKKVFLLGRLIFIFSILQKSDSIFKEFFCFTKIIFFFKSAKLFGSFLIVYHTFSKINQDSCLGCLGGDDAPVILWVNANMGYRCTIICLSIVAYN